MANATFGVNIIPKDSTVTIGNNDKPWTITSPNLTGVPTAPTALTGTSTTQIATTAFVKDATINTIADEYDATATYDVGDYCIHDGKLYKCSTAIESAEPWNSTHWTETKLADEAPDMSLYAPKASPVFTGSISLGRKANSTVGSNSVAEGTDATASGANSHAEGSGTIASGAQSHAEGYGGTYTRDGVTYTSEAKGTSDHVEGYQCLTNVGQPGNHAEGYWTRATGGASHAEGNCSVASGSTSHAEGNYTVASGTYSHAEGYGSTYTSGGITYTSGAKGITDHTEGYQTIADSGSDNYAAHAEGYQTRALSNAAHAEGILSVASGYCSHAEGNATTASASYSHAEGNTTTASGTYAHSEGYTTTASGNESHAEGYYTTASGHYSHAEGHTTTASKPYAHAEGHGTIAQRDSQHVSGEYNIADTSSTTHGGLYAEIIGNGTADNARSNARALDWGGNERLMGDVYVGCQADSTGGTKLAKITDVPSVTGKADKVTSATEGHFAALDANGNLTDSGHSHADYLTQHQDISGKLDASEKGANNGVAELDSSGKVPTSQLPSYVDDVLEYNSSSAFPSTGEAGKIYIATDTNITYRWGGSEYVPIGSDLALGETSSTAYRGDRGAAAYAAAVTNVETTPTSSSTNLITSGGVYTALGDYAPKESPVFTGSISLGRNGGSTTGLYSTTLGLNCTASGTYGIATGNSTEATANMSFAQGQQTHANGANSHAEGYATYATGLNSHVEGSNTMANHANQHVFGEYNYGDSSTAAATARGNYVEIVGNGTSGSNSNARTLDWDGNERLMGQIYVGCNADSTGGTQLTPPVNMTGATSSTAGTAGYVPAPAAGDEGKFLKADGTWATITDPGVKIIRVTGTITNTSGSYSGSFSDTRITSDMESIAPLELSNPEIFGGDISVTCNNGSITIACADVAGTSTFIAKFLASDISSTEYNALNNAKVNINQGTVNAGKVLGINSQGMVEPVESQDDTKILYVTKTNISIDNGDIDIDLSSNIPSGYSIYNIIAHVVYGGTSVYALPWFKTDSYQCLFVHSWSGTTVKLVNVNSGSWGSCTVNFTFFLKKN